MFYKIYNSFYLPTLFGMFYKMYNSFNFATVFGMVYKMYNSFIKNVQHFQLSDFIFHVL